MLNSAARRPASGTAFRALEVLVFIGIVFASRGALADGMHDAERLLKAHDYKQAMAQVDHVLAAKPGDPKARFLKGVILTEAGDSKQAIHVFKNLTQDYPELPEPYNNLAVIYAAEGRYELARDELEKALRTHPSYATAYENLGDVYAKLASQAYDKALQIDSSNSTAQDKLALIRKLIGGPPESIDEGRGVAVAAATHAAAPAAAAAAPKPVPNHPATQLAEAKPAPAKPAPHAEHATAVAKAVEKAKPPAPPRKPMTPAPRAKPAHEAAPSPAATEGAILATVQAWARAWSAQDVGRYLSFYAKNFETPHGEPRSRWERIRHERVSAPKSISVTVDSPRVTLEPHGEAKVTFRQLYRTKRLTLEATKTLVLEKSGSRWLIRREEVAH